jgi:hypothetical protein
MGVAFILLGLIIAAVTLRRTGANDTWYSVFIVAIIFLVFVFLQDFECFARMRLYQSVRPSAK